MVFLVSNANSIHTLLKVGVLTFGSYKTDITTFTALTAIFWETKTAGSASHVYPQGIQKF